MRRTPPGQIQKFYKRLYDLYERYPKRWTEEKGYGDADYFRHKMKGLLRDIQAALEGKPIPGTAPEGAMHVRRHIEAQARPYRQPDWGRSPEFEPEYEPDVPLPDLRRYYGEPPPRRITMTPRGTRFVPKKSKSRSIRPSFMRRGKK